ncbi:hypothetical protein IMG5_116380 [Ichthyophthirius multifiliis]|uniref:Uncharacterized protein n=1 Tax=Ichthyophthirius multifiliis TaxID=5932 RepID=G0QUD0_ICHMU|nr:hypothetical protein IMG5_116380 [Ichthyophthirius multifiliis]EGR31167.1 hypothetical protein IMG5_116380 [Ichthyophthirius multifiliis]|eukprot:XP_004034653.1 hypothetical protein IMG5_116380 [Ichthyophthirius multifiliis]
MQKKIKPSPRGNYLNDCEYIGDLLPGPGNYNPRPILPKIKINNTKPEQWRQKHKELEQKKQKKYNTPDMGTYKYNYPSTYDTFGKIYQKLQDSGGKLTKSAVNYLGKTERFKDISKSKSKQITNAPGPGHYPLIAQWPGKESKKEQFNYLEKISKGIEKSIYYENS